MRGSTFLIGPLNFDCRNPGKKIFFSLSSLSLSICFPLLFPSLFASLPPLSNALLPLFSSHPISFSFSFSHLFLFSFLFLLSFFFSSLTFLFLLLTFPSTEFIKVGETHPPPPPPTHFPLSHLSSPCIFLIFLDFLLSSLLHHSTHASM